MKVETISARSEDSKVLLEIHNGENVRKYTKIKSYDPQP